jgi:hypothetical protein
VRAWLGSRGLLEVASLTVIQEAMSRAGRAAAEAVVAAWRETLVKLARPLRPCPCCGRDRKCKWRRSQPRRTARRPRATAIADATWRCTTARTLSGRALRRLALEVEQSAMAFAKAERTAQLERLGDEARTLGVPLVLLEADGGKVRTGTLEACEPRDAGFGQRTPKRGLPRKKRPVSWREVITMDAREPGVADATALGQPSAPRSSNSTAANSNAGCLLGSRSLSASDVSRTNRSVSSGSPPRLKHTTSLRSHAFTWPSAAGATRRRAPARRTAAFYQGVEKRSREVTECPFLLPRPGIAMAVWPSRESSRPFFNGRLGARARHRHRPRGYAALRLPRDRTRGTGRGRGTLVIRSGEMPGVSRRHIVC